MNNNTCSIMQPHFMPWMGYFHLIKHSDIFILLDDAQFEKQSWQNRNRLLVNRAEMWLSVPVIKHPLDKKINETHIDLSRNWHRKTLATLENSFSKSSYFFQILPILDILAKEDPSLLNLNVLIIKKILDFFGLETKVYLASEFETDAKRTQKLIQLLDAVSAEKYLSPIGSKEYLEEDKFSAHTSCILEFQNFNNQKYKNISSKLSLNNLSIVHYLANYSYDEIMNELLI